MKRKPAFPLAGKLTEYNPSLDLNPKRRFEPGKSPEKKRECRSKFTPTAPVFRSEAFFSYFRQFCRDSLRSGFLHSHGNNRMGIFRELGTL